MIWKAPANLTIDGMDAKPTQTQYQDKPDPKPKLQVDAFSPSKQRLNPRASAFHIVSLSVPGSVEMNFIMSSM